MEISYCCVGYRKPIYLWKPLRLKRPLGNPLALGPPKSIYPVKDPFNCVWILAICKRSGSTFGDFVLLLYLQKKTLGKSHRLEVPKKYLSCKSSFQWCFKYWRYLCRFRTSALSTEDILTSRSSSV